MALDAKRATNARTTTGKAAPGNTGLSRRNASGEPLVLAVGCDTLYWSARADLGATYDALYEARGVAEAEGSSMPWNVVDGHSFSILPHGIGRYRVVLDCFEMRVQLTDSAHIPSVRVELRSAFLLEMGMEAAFERSVSVARQIVGGEMAEPHVSRIDLYADYAGWVLTHADYAGFVTNAKRHTVGSDATEYETVQAGKTPFLVRLYRKDVERRQRREPAPPTWGDWDGPVTRVEVQASTDFLRRLGLRTFAEVRASLGDIWRCATVDFLQLRAVGRGHRESWALRPEWRMVQETGLQHFPTSGVVPFRITRGDRVNVLRLLYGCFASLGAIEGLSAIADVAERACVLFPLISDGATFAEKVRRRRARLARAVLLTHVDFDAASAGAEKENSACEGPSQVHTAGGPGE